MRANQHKKNTTIAPPRQRRRPQGRKLCEADFLHIEDENENPDWLVGAN